MNHCRFSVYLKDAINEIGSIPFYPLLKIYPLSKSLMHPFCPFLLNFLRKRACYREMSQLISFFSKQQEGIKSCASAVICSWLSEEKRESQGTTDSQCFNRTNQ